MQIEKECPAIMEAFNKFDQWLLGKSDITVHTDHQPLQSIFQKDLAAAPKRLQKMMLSCNATTLKMRLFSTPSRHTVQGTMPRQQHPSHRP